MKNFTIYNLFHRNASELKLTNVRNVQMGSAVTDFTYGTGELIRDIDLEFNISEKFYEYDFFAGIYAIYKNYALQEHNDYIGIFTEQYKLNLSTNNHNADIGRFESTYNYEQMCQTFFDKKVLTKLDADLVVHTPIKFGNENIADIFQKLALTNHDAQVIANVLPKNYQQYFNEVVADKEFRIPVGIFKKDILKSMGDFIFPLLEKLEAILSINYDVRQKVATRFYLMQHCGIVLYNIFLKSLANKVVKQDVQLLEIARSIPTYQLSNTAADQFTKYTTVLAFNANNLPTISATIASIVSNVDRQDPTLREYEFVLICSNSMLGNGLGSNTMLTEQNYVISARLETNRFLRFKAFLASIQNTTNIRFTFRFVDFDGLPNIANFPLDGREFPEVYAKLYIPEILKDYSTKVLYLDIDTIVNCDIQELFAVNLGNNCLAAVQDFNVQGEINKLDANSLGKISTLQSLGITNIASYFSPAVMLFDLLKIHKKNYLTLDSIARYCTNIVPKDFLAKYQANAQDILNEIFTNQVKFLDMEYATPCTTVNNVILNYHFIPLQQVYAHRKLLNKPTSIKVFNFTGTPRPTSSDVELVEDIIHIDYFRKYLFCTPFAKTGQELLEFDKQVFFNYIGVKPVFSASR